MPQSQQRLYYLDNLRLFLILLIVFHHSSGAYTQAFAQNWFTRDGMMFRDFFFDGIYMMADTVMLQGIFFLSGLFTVFSMTRHEVGGMIRERGMRLLTPLLFVVPLLLPPLSYPRYLDVLKINPTWYGPFPLSYGEYVFSSVFWEKMVAGGPYWFLVFLFLITLIFAGFRQFLGGLYQKLQTWVQGALETSSLRALFSFIGLMSLFVWGGD
ncbi:acyltransferase family protein [Alphaproteobacteria bacterium]|nr:acyltransferase family protein [Alphaproteobacteria bacterium]